MIDSADGFSVQTEAITDGFILRPQGDIDLSRSPALRTEIAQVLKRSPMRLVVDLTDVPYMDSSGVATLLEAMQLVRRQQGRLVLCGLQEKVRAIFEIARLDMVFKIVNDAATAKTA